MDDVESQIPDGDGDHQINAARRCSLWCIVTLLLVLGFLLLAVILASTEYYRLQTHYSVAIDSVSGLDPKTGLSFNLTLGVASRSYGSEACIHPGTYMKVAYNGVQLETSAPETQTLCARPRKAVQQQQQQVLAMATAVPVGKALGGLAADMKRGMAMFDVTLHLPAGSYGGAYGWLSGCKGLRVGLGAVECESPN